MEEKGKLVLNTLLAELWMVGTLPERVSEEVRSRVRKPVSRRTLKSSPADLAEMCVKDASGEGSERKEERAIGNEERGSLLHGG